MVEQVLLELVEQQVELAAPLRRGRDGVHDPCRRPQIAALGVHGIDQAGGWILGPRVVKDDGRAALLPQPAGDARAEQRALADAARPIEDGQPAREHVRRDRRDLTLATEEEQRVELGVLEGGEALVRTLREAAHRAAFSSIRSSSTTYAAGAMSTTSTSRRRQNSRSSGCGPACTDQER